MAQAESMPVKANMANLIKENSSLRGHVRRLEKSNQELALENFRLKGGSIGWNKIG